VAELTAGDKRYLLLNPADLMSHNMSLCCRFFGVCCLPQGDFLLLGIDRRNSSETVSAAYNDTRCATHCLHCTHCDASNGRRRQPAGSATLCCQCVCASLL
jgi:hypothetical protein